jgi:tetratricopeptide (TPR) repeat protein
LKAILVALILIPVLASSAWAALTQVDAQAAFARGVAAFNECDYATAAAEFEQAVSADRSVAFRLCLAVTYSAQGDYEGAKEQLKAAKQVDPHNVVVYFLLANAYERTGESEARDATMDLVRNEFSIVDGMVFKSGSTEKVLTDAVKTYPDCAILHNLLADAYTLQGKLDLAESEYTKAGELAPCWSKPAQNIGSLYIRRGETQKAEDELRRAQELDPGDPTSNVQMAKVMQMQGKGAEALAEITQAQELGYDPVEALVKKGDLLLDQGKYDQALSTYEDALDQAMAKGQLRLQPPTDGRSIHIRRPPLGLSTTQPLAPGAQVVRGAASSAIFSRTLLNMALIYAHRDDWPRMMDSLWAATYLDPMIMSAADNLISYLVGSKKIETAIAEFESQLPMNSSDLSSLHFLAKAYGAEGDKERSFHYYDMLVNEAPTNEEFLLGFGEVANSLGQFGKTVDFLAPQYASGIGHGKFEEVLAVAYFELGNFEEAARMAKVRIGLGAKSPRCYSILRQALSRLGRVDEAIDVLSQGAQAAKDDAEIRLELARAFREADDLTQASYAYEDAIDLGLDQPDVLMESAQTLEDAGRTGEALAKYRAVLDADPGNAAAKQAVQRLSQGA